MLYEAHNYAFCCSEFIIISIIIHLTSAIGSSQSSSCSCDNSVLLVVSVVLAVLVVLLVAALVVSLIMVCRLHGSNRQSVSSAIPVDDNVAYSELKEEAKASESEAAQYEEIPVKN